MTKLALVLALAGSLVACSKKDDGGGGGGGGGNTAGGGGDCGAAVDKALTAMTGGPNGAMPGIEEVKGQLRGVYVKHCETNHWSGDILNCFASATGQPAIKACREKLPPEQAQAISAEIRSIMMGAMSKHGGEGAPMHGGGGGMGGGTPPMGGTEGPPPSGSGH